MSSFFKKERVRKHFIRVGLALVSTIFLLPSTAGSVEPVEAIADIIGSEGGAEAGKAALNATLKTLRSKPAMAIATGITCVACIPVAGAAASPCMCIACVILIAKTFG